MANSKPEALKFARELRRNETAAEIKLWEGLRGRRLGGFKFVRQLAIGSFIADFVCREKRLIIEVDGATHSSDSEIDYDKKRTALLMSQGYRVHRVNNDDVYQNFSDVLDHILMILEGRE